MELAGSVEKHARAHHGGGYGGDDGALWPLAKPCASWKGLLTCRSSGLKAIATLVRAQWMSVRYVVGVEVQDKQ